MSAATVTPQRRVNMKKRILSLAMGAMLLTFGLVLTGCGNNCDNDGHCQVTFVSIGAGMHAPSSQSECGNSGCATNNSDRLVASISSGATINCDC